MASEQAVPADLDLLRPAARQAGSPTPHARPDAHALRPRTPGGPGELSACTKCATNHAGNRALRCPIPRRPARRHVWRCCQCSARAAHERARHGEAFWRTRALQPSSARLGRPGFHQGDAVHAREGNALTSRAQDKKGYEVRLASIREWRIWAAASTRQFAAGRQPPGSTTNELGDGGPSWA